MGPAGDGILNGEFAPDGRHLVTGNAYGTMFVFRLPDLST